MALEVTSVRAYGIEVGEAITKKFIQHVIVKGTGASGDLTHLGALGGTHLNVASAATLKKVLADVAVRADHVVSVAGPTVGVYALGVLGALSPGVCAIWIEDHLPQITYNTGDAPADYTYHLVYELKDGELPVEITA